MYLGSNISSTGGNSNPLITYSYPLIEYNYQLVTLNQPLISVLILYLVWSLHPSRTGGSSSFWRIL